MSELVRLVPPTKPITYKPSKHVTDGVMIKGMWFGRAGLEALGFTVERVDDEPSGSGS